MQSGGSGPGHVAGCVVEEHGSVRRDTAEQLEDVEEDRGIRLSHADFGRVDDHLEQLVDRDQLVEGNAKLEVAGGTDVPLAEQRFGCIVTVRDGKIVRTEVYPSPEQALEALGLRE